MTYQDVKCILWKCVLIGLSFLLYMFVMVFGLQDFAYKAHSYFIDIPRGEWEILMFTFVGAFKMLWFVLFVIPYAAMWWHSRG